MRRAPAFVRRIRAAFGGYFWLDCPVCGEKFGGYERPAGHLARDSRGGCMYCWRCVARYGDRIEVPAATFDIRKGFDVPLALMAPELLPTSASAEVVAAGDD